jgi:hypothetical protein
MALLELERSGTLDGQGYWLNTDKVLDAARRLAVLAEQRIGAIRR